MPVAVARSFSDGVAICYVLPVLWMKSCFHTVSYGASCVFSSDDSVTAENAASIPTKFCSTIKISRCTSWVDHQRRSKLSVTVLLLSLLLFYCCFAVVLAHCANSVELMYQSGVWLSVCCVTFAESEPYCHSILFVCLDVCRSRQPFNAYSCHCERDASCHMTCVSVCLSLCTVRLSVLSCIHSR